MTLAELLADLERRAQEAEAIGATAPVSAVLRQVAATIERLNGNSKPTTTPAGELLTVEDAARRLGVAPRWLYRHATTLPFAHRLSPKVLRFDAEGLARWAARR